MENNHRINTFPASASKAPRPRKLEHLDDRVGFELGWDFAMTGVSPVGDQLSYRQVALGYKQAQLNLGSRRIAAGDRFTRKVLQIRFNAWLRGREIDTSVLTPAALQAINVDVCPIMRLPLTHSQNGPMDWSVDRVNNAEGYVPGNLTIISRLANEAKYIHGSIELIRIARMVNNSGHLFVGLDSHQWARLACLASMQETMDLDLLLTWPMVLTPPKGIAVSIPWACKATATERVLAQGPQAFDSLSLGSEQEMCAAAAFASALDYEVQKLCEAGVDSKCAGEDAWWSFSVKQAWVAWMNHRRDYSLLQDLLVKLNSSYV